MIACEAMTVATVARRHKRIMRPFRAKLIERAFDRAGVGEEQTALAEIIEGEGRQRHAEPGDADRKRPEMAHVGVERFAAGHGQESAADHDKGQRPGVPKIGDGRSRAERREHGGRLDDSDDAERADRR